MGISALLAAQILDASATGRSVITGADASAIRTTLGLGTLATQSPTGTPSASTFLRGDYSWQTIDLSGYLPLAGGTMTGQLTITQGTANTSVLTSTGYSLTGSNAQSLMDLSGTWNTTGTPTALKLNVTDTASNAASLLMDLQTASTTRFRVWKDGSIQNANGSMALATSFSFNWVTGPEFRLTPAAQIIWATTSATSGGSDLVLVREAAQTLAQRNSTSPQVHRWYNTRTDASNYERAKLEWESNVLRIGTEKAGTGSARALELQTDGTTRLTIASTGAATFSGNVTSAGEFQSSGTGGFIARQSSTGAAIGITNTSSGRIDQYANFFQWVRNNPFNAVMTLDATTGQLGIGTASPAAKLDIADTTGAGSGSLAASALNIAQTWNTTGTPTALKLNVTDTASNAASLLLDLQVGGTSKFRVGKNGALIGSESSIFLSSGAGQQLAGAISTNFVFSISSQPTQGFRVVTTIPIGWASFTGGLDGALTAGWYQDASNAIAQRNATNAQTFRVYNTFTDSSNYERAKIAWESNVLRIGTEKAGTGSARALELQTDGVTRLTIGTTGLFTIADASDIAVGTTTGTKIGTATTQKLGFFNATPVVQPTAVADATDAASVITQLNALLSRMRNLGLIAT